jgi:hypothetical protein
MIPCEHSVVLSLYSQIAPGPLFRQLQRNLGMNVHDGIYSPRVLIWMMLEERWDAEGTVAGSVRRLAEGDFDCLLSECKRARTKRISLATGGYCQARQHLPKMLIERTMEALIQTLRQTLQSRLGKAGGSVYVIDGTSIQLTDANLADEYPPGRNQHRRSHWPLTRMVVVQDVETGLAERPYWGPQNGPEAVSEQALADQALAALPAGSVVIGDRNFGVFSTAYACHLRGQPVIVRLTEKRATALVGHIAAEGSQPLQWRPSTFERRKRADLLETAAVPGRLIACRVGKGKHKQWLYLFTTWEIADSAVVEWYGKRWNVESDLRCLKQTLRLQRINVRSTDMLDKELLAAMIGYNLVRAVMCLAAHVARVQPRQLSFTRAYGIVHSYYAKVLNAPTYEAQLREFERMVEWVAQCKLYPRSKAKSYPRRIWPKTRSYPLHRLPEN